MYQSTPALPPPRKPGAFFLAMVWEHLSGQMPGDRDENTIKFVARCEMRKCFLTPTFLIIYIIVLDVKFPNL